MEIVEEVGLQIDSVPGITQFEMPKSAIHGSQGVFTEADMRSLTFSYYSPLVSLMVADGNAVINKVWSSTAGEAADPLYEISRQKLPDPKTETVETVNVTLIENEATLKIWANSATPLSSFEISVHPEESLLEKKIAGDLLLISLKRAKDSGMVEIRVVRKSAAVTGKLSAPFAGFSHSLP